MSKAKNIFTKEYESKNITQESDLSREVGELREPSEEEAYEDKYSISKPRREIIRAIIIYDKSKDR